ncbi:MAG TPA: M24 family metallopeptidase [Gemmatimonadales bacterium]|nr:M24 family metallopeptidase [Gemmatimonadales bacterium]
MMLLAGLNVAQVQATLRDLGLDGWLLFDFRGINPIPTRLLGDIGFSSRRLFILIPREGEPAALVHKIELGPFKDGAFPGRVTGYARWEELHEALAEMVRGKSLAMEISPDDAVPYLDRVPFGVVELVRRLGGRVTGSAALVTRFASAWSAGELEGHVAAAEALASVAKEALAWAVTQGGRGLTESQLQARVVEAIHQKGLVFDHPPIVGFGPNAANPHYEPVPGKDLSLERDQVVLVDLWGGPRLGTVFADQTWMGFSGSRVPAKVEQVWRVVREARDATIALVRRKAGREPLHGYQGDDAAREVITKAGYGAFFVHRTGHSIDRDLHGSGPHLDDYETRDDREILPGAGFSVEPGIYLPGEFGVRSEVNMVWAPGGPMVTPKEPQVELILP